MRGAGWGWYEESAFEDRQRKVGEAPIFGCGIEMMKATVGAPAILQRKLIFKCAQGRRSRYPHIYWLIQMFDR